MDTIAYKKNAEWTVERLKLLYNRQSQNIIFASFDVPSPALDNFRKEQPEGFCEYPDIMERINFWDAYLKERIDLEDDAIPSAYLSEFDQGLYGGMVGGEAQFMRHDNGWISSMVKPILKNWKDFDSLYLGESHIWSRRLVEQTVAFVEGAGENFGISHFILIDGLNFVFELVGATKTYESLFVCPDMVKRAIEFAFDLNVRVQNSFFDHVPSFFGGTFSNMAQWIPGRIVSESVDPFHMTSVDYFEKWGRENVELMFANFDGGVLHIHGNGRHLLEAVSTITGLKAIWLGDDIGFPPAIDVLHELKKQTGDVPLVLQVPFQKFLERFKKHDLPGGVFYQVTDAPNIKASNIFMDHIRKYRL